MNEDKKNVLVIDDDVQYCMLVNQYLENLNFRVKYVHTLEEGLNAIKLFSPDIMILDYHLGDEIGLDLLQNKEKHAWDFSVVLASGSINEKVKANATELGVKEIIPKPFKLSSLQKILSKLI